MNPADSPWVILEAMFLDYQRYMLALGLAIPRIFTIFAVAPFFGGKLLTNMVKSAIVGSFTLILVPIIVVQIPPEGLAPGQFILLAFKETLIGLLIGYGVAIIFWVAASIGSLIDAQRGSSMGGMMDPTMGDQAEPSALLLNRVISAVFVLGGGMLIFLDLLYQSYIDWPPLSYYPDLAARGIPLFMIERFQQLMYLAVFLAGPVVLAMFISELALAIISRYAQQLNVFVLAQPVKSEVAYLILILYMSALMQQFTGGFVDFVQVFRGLEVLMQ